MLEGAEGFFMPGFTPPVALVPGIRSTTGVEVSPHAHFEAGLHHSL